MKVFGLPPEVPFETHLWNGVDFVARRKAEQEHEKALAQYLRESGFIGKHTGRIVTFPVADGCAVYMMADFPRKAVLVHLPYGDAWHSDLAEYMPKREILKRMDMQESLTTIPPMESKGTQ